MFEQAGKPSVFGGQPEVPLPPDLDSFQFFTEGPWATGEFGVVSENQVNEWNADGLFGFHVVAHIALCDGSVHGLASDVDGSVVAALLSRTGQEIIDANDWQELAENYAYSGRRRPEKILKCLCVTLDRQRFVLFKQKALNHVKTSDCSRRSLQPFELTDWGRAGDAGTKTQTLCRKSTHEH